MLGRVRGRAMKVERRGKVRWECWARLEACLNGRVGVDGKEKGGNVSTHGWRFLALGTIRVRWSEHGG